MGGVHGNDERISVENMVRGARLMFEVLADLCLEGS
jgi:di/tripeptidase